MNTPEWAVPLRTDLHAGGREPFDGLLGGIRNRGYSVKVTGENRA